jgi:hypothetical protein
MTYIAFSTYLHYIKSDKLLDFTVFLLGLIFHEKNPYIRQTV